MARIKSILFFLLFFLSIPVFAVNSSFLNALHGMEFSAAGGPNWTHSDDTSLIVSNDETDNLMVSDISKGAMWKIGVGYYFLQEQLSKRKFITDLLVELNLYHNSTTIKGDVFRYQLPEYDSYRFNAPITTTRLLLDVKPGLFTTYHVTLYPILGFGAAYSDVSYEEEITDSHADPASYHSLGTHANLNVSYDLGAGVRMDITQNISASLEYLYNYLVNLTPADESTSDAELLSPPTFTVYNQSILLGLSWKI